MSMILIRSRVKTFFSYTISLSKYVDISIRRRNSSSATVETEDNFSWVMGEALSPFLVEGGVFSGGVGCGFEVPATVGGLEEPAGVLAFTAGEGFDGSIAAVSAIV